MSNLSVAFIRASVAYLAFGLTLGAIMAFDGGFSWLAGLGAGTPTTAHAHAQLLGFMMSMVSGVAYHIFPRFTGNPLRYPWTAWANFWLCQAGTAGMVLGFLFRGALPWLLPTAAITQSAGLLLFIYNMWTVVRPLKRLMP